MSCGEPADHPADRPLDELAQRVRAADRPRVNVGTTLEDDLRAIWSESEEKYRRAADLTFDTDGKSVEEVVAELKPAIRDYLSGS